MVAVCSKKQQPAKKKSNDACENGSDVENLGDKEITISDTGNRDKGGSLWLLLRNPFRL